MSYNITVSTLAMHLAVVPEDPIAAIVVSSLIKQENLIDNLLINTIDNMGNKIHNAFAYAKNDYTLALPTGKTTQLNVLTLEEVAAVIAVDINYAYAIEATYYQYGLFTPLQAITPYLITNRGYDVRTGKISIYSGVTFYPLSYMVVKDVTITTDGESASITYGHYGYLSVTLYDGEGFPYTVQEWGELATYTEIVPLDDPTNTLYNDDCIYAVYQKYDSLGAILPEEYYWIYRLNNNIYPEVNHTDVGYTADEFLPVIPIRYKNKDLTDASLSETDLYKTSVILSDQLGMSFTGLGTSINANPDVGEIDHAYVMFGVDLQTKESTSWLYLNEFFNHLYNLNVTSNYSITANNKISFTEYGLNLSLIYSSITSQVIPGQVDDGRIGNSRYSMSGTWFPEEYYYAEENGYHNASYTDSTLTIDTQITPLAIRRVVVKNLELTNRIYKSYGITTTIVDVMNDPENHNFIIPIQYNLANELSLIQQNNLYIDCALLVINTVVKTKLKWYQSTWFKIVMFIIVAAVIIITAQYEFAPALMAAITTTEIVIIDGIAVVTIVMLTGTALLYALALFVAQMIIIGLVVNYAVQWIVKKYGTKLGIIGAIILTTVALVLTQGRSIGLMSQLWLTTAQAMLQIATALISAVNEFLVEAGQKLVKEYADFSDKLKDRYADLQEVYDLLEPGLIDPLVYVQVPRNRLVFEYPDQFIQRTLGLVDNTMYILHDEISNYCSTRLQVSTDLPSSMYAQNLYA